MKDGKFRVGDKIECVELGFNAWITRGNKYTVKNVWNEAVCQSIQIANDSGIDTIYPAHLFKLAEPIFEQEYFSALNEKDADKYVGKTMEFADGDQVRNNDWLKGTLSDVKKVGSSPFHVIGASNYQFMRTCPETFTKKKKKVKKVYERWVNLYPGPGNCYYKTEEEAKKNACDDLITCLHIRQEYEIEE